jgi:hypothetical protein
MTAVSIEKWHILIQKRFVKFKPHHTNQSRYQTNHTFGKKAHSHTGDAV